MSDTQPRCPIYRWPYRPEGCTPTSCCFRPHEYTAEHAANAERRAAYDRLREAGNHAPTLEDVDAELQPKGLQVLTLTEPVWVNSWYHHHHSYERTLISIRDFVPPQTRTVLVGRGPDGLWGYYAGRVGNTDVHATNHPTPEAAQAACEAAIIAAWRAR